VKSTGHILKQIGHKMSYLVFFL